MLLAYRGADTDLARCPAPTRTLATQALARFPGLRLGSSIRPTDPYPDHRAGAAVDLMTTDQALHQQLTGWVLAQHQAGALRVRSIISWRRRWTPTTGWAPYRGALPHTDHVHIWLDTATPLPAYPLTGVRRGGRPAYYGPRSGPAWSAGGSHPADRPAITRIQAVLRAAGHDLGAAGIDGIIGPATATAIRAWQRTHQLTADGLVGPATWAALMR